MLALTNKGALSAEDIPSVLIESLELASAAKGAAATQGPRRLSHKWRERLSMVLSCHT